MWDIEDAESRLKEGHNLFLGIDEEGPLAHVWFNSSYLYNCYINPRRENGYGEKFLESCFNLVPFHTITLHTDEWNVRAQKFFEKVGFTKI
jgi:ribosomal protein S18 acetylase RimI-like enzyme